MNKAALRVSTSSLLRTLREQLRESGDGRETLGPIQTAMLKGYLAEYLAIQADAVLEGVARDVPERPTLQDAITVLQQILSGLSAKAEVYAWGSAGSKAAVRAVRLGARLGESAALRARTIGWPSAALASGALGMKGVDRAIGALLAGCAAALGAGAALDVYSVSRWRSGDLMTIAVAAGLFLLAFRAGMPWMRAQLGLPPAADSPDGHLSRDRDLKGAAAAVLFGLAVDGIWSFAGDAASRLTIYSIVPLAAVVTWFWMTGTENGRSATSLGARSGVIAGCIIGYLVALSLGPGFDVYRTVLIFALRGGLIGWAGGLALDRGWAAAPWGMMKTLVTASLVWWILILPFLSRVDIWGGLLVTAGFGAGWAIAVSDPRGRPPLRRLAVMPSSAA